MQGFVRTMGRRFRWRSRHGRFSQALVRAGRQVHSRLHIAVARRSHALAFPRVYIYICPSHNSGSPAVEARVVATCLRAFGPACVIGFTSSEPRDLGGIPTHGVDHLEGCQSFSVAKR